MKRLKITTQTIDALDWQPVYASIDCDSLIFTNLGNASLDFRTDEEDAGSSVSIVAGVSQPFAMSWTRGIRFSDDFRFHAGDCVGFFKAASGVATLKTIFML
jgi:hypothetical protein